MGGAYMGYAWLGEYTVFSYHEKWLCFIWTKIHCDISNKLGSAFFIVIAVYLSNTNKKKIAYFLNI